VEVLDSTYTVETSILQIPIPIPTMSDRESLFRSVNVRNEHDRSFANIAYTVEDERRPVDGAKVRREPSKGEVRAGSNTSWLR
jgi:hypothetical protein